MLNTVLNTGWSTYALRTGITQTHLEWLTGWGHRHIQRRTHLGSHPDSFSFSSPLSLGSHRHFFLRGHKDTSGTGVTQTHLAALYGVVQARPNAVRWGHTDAFNATTRSACSRIITHPAVSCGVVAFCFSPLGCL